MSDQEQKKKDRKDLKKRLIDGKQKIIKESNNEILK